ncbi:MAG: type II secretion system protein GspG [Myxococcaceae bacterium]
MFQECGQRERRFARRDVAAIQEALESYRTRTGNWPAEDRWAQTLVAAGLLERAPVDPWGNPYEYRLVLADGGSRPQVTSLGPDGQPESSDDVPNRSWP